MATRVVCLALRVRHLCLFHTAETYMALFSPLPWLSDPPPELFIFSSKAEKSHHSAKLLSSESEICVTALTSQHHFRVRLCWPWSWLLRGLLTLFKVFVLNKHFIKDCYFYMKITTPRDTLSWTVVKNHFIYTIIIFKNNVLFVFMFSSDEW